LGGRLEREGGKLNVSEPESRETFRGELLSGGRGSKRVPPKLLKRSEEDHLGGFAKPARKPNSGKCDQIRFENQYGGGRQWRGGLASAFGIGREVFG